MITCSENQEKIGNANGCDKEYNTFFACWNQKYLLNWHVRILLKYHQHSRNFVKPDYEYFKILLIVEIMFINDWFEFRSIQNYNHYVFYDLQLVIPPIVKFIMSTQVSMIILLVNVSIKYMSKFKLPCKPNLTTND